MTDLTERDVILSILKRESHNLKDRFGVLKVGLFGSVVRDEAGERSDNDLLIEFDPESVPYKKYPDPEMYLLSLLPRIGEISPLMAYLTTFSRIFQRKWCGFEGVYP